MNEPLAPNSDSDLQRKKLEKGGQLHGVHWFIIALSILLTFGAWYYSSNQVFLKNEEKFNREADQALTLLKERMELYENALSGGVALIHSNGGKIAYEQWHAYANSMHVEQKYPGINGIGVIFNVKLEELEAYLDQETKARPDFKIHPDHDEAEYWPITYIEPSAANQAAIGLDMAFETNRYTAIKKARDTGAPQVTGPITLVQDDKQTPGFLFYAPFYTSSVTPQTLDEKRNQIIGVTYAPFIMEKLMRGTLASQQRQVSFTIKDDNAILFEDTLADRDPEPLFTKKTSMEMYGRIWSFDIKSSQSFRRSSANNQPYWILFGGLIIDTLLFALFIFLTRANRQALRYADEMNEALHVKSTRLEKSNEDLEQLSYIASHDLRAPLNAINQVAGWIEEDCADILPDTSKEHLNLLKQRSQRMAQLLQDLRSYSLVNQFADDKETVNLAQATQSISFLIGREQSITCSAPDINIEIQRVPFETVLRNLISNAIKHHDKDKGSVTVHYTREEKAHVFLVEDDGPGIPDNMHAKIFEMYQTLKPRDIVEGSGMGLAIVKKILGHYEGKITIEAGRSKGTRFNIMWPTDPRIEV
tara:strand:+ start:1123 stop:2889 length:1767 start_codon:yes stop_codon:yes gene_type:complete